jgi:lambda family phage portal protein
MLKEWRERRRLKKELETLQLKAKIQALGRFTGADKSRRSMREWKTYTSDANSEILPDLPALRERSRDLCQNNAIALGAMETKSINVIGRGFNYQSRLNRDVVSMTDDAAHAWNQKKEREWSLFWDSKDLDAAGKLSGHWLMHLMYRGMNIDGDSIIIFRKVSKSLNRPYQIGVQVIEADQLSNPDNAQDTITLAGGVEMDDFGRPVRYHFSKVHPGAVAGGLTQDWVNVDAVSKRTGLPNVVHFFRQKRPGQSRGVPDLHAVIEPLRQLSNYSEAELSRTVVNSLVALIIETPTGEALPDEALETSKSLPNTKDMKLEAGMIMGLAKGEKAFAFDPKAPSSAYDGFFAASLKQIGMALNIPYEILVKHFSASFSASKAAILEFWRWVLTERKFLVDMLIEPIHDVFMYEAVSSGRIVAPGYFSDPVLRKAYNNFEFRGPSKGHLNETDEVNAAILRIDSGLSNLAIETSELSGGDWEINHKQSAHEFAARVKDGLIVDPKSAMQVQPKSRE